jgi:PAS domain S-box-containing protein
MNDYGLLVADRIDAMLAYWDQDQICRFANNAYMAWFGKSKEEMVDKITMKELLGPLYEKNLPYITEALNGKVQQFEREIKTPHGEIRHSLANYYPDLYNGKVRGFSVHVVDITPQKKVQQELRNSEAKLSTLFNSSPAGITLSTISGKLVEVNQAVLDIYGYESKEEFINTPVWDLYVDEHDRTHLIEQFKKEGVVNNIQVRQKRKNGEVIWIYGNTHTLKMPDGERFLLSTILDVTEQKLAEAKLKESEDRFRGLFNFSPIGLILTTADGKLLEANRAVLQIMEMDSQEELITKPAQDYYVEPEERIRMFNLLQKDGFVSGFELKVKRKSGEHAWISNNMKPFKFGNNNPQLISAVVDITERKKIEEELQVSKAKFKKIFQSSPVGIVIHRLSDSRYVEVNEAFCKITGFTEEEVLGRTSMELGLILDIEAREEILKRIKKNGFENDIELSIRHKSGKILNILTSTEIILIDGTPHAINIIFDMTERKLAELQLKEAYKELDAFSYSVAHDLRTPLRSVYGYAEILNEDYEKQMDDEGKRLLKNIKYYAAKMGHLIDDLLSFSRLGRKEIQVNKVNMRELTNVAITEINHSISHQATILVDELPEVMGDYSLLSQVMVNLISNAVKYSSKKENPIVQISAAVKNEEIIFSVKDNGAGFDMKYYDKLFGVFQRLHTEKEFDGTGIGLAIVHRIITKHGGKMWAEGKVGEGATFNFSLLKQ